MNFLFENVNACKNMLRHIKEKTLEIFNKRNVLYKSQHTKHSYDSRYNMVVTVEYGI